MQTVYFTQSVSRPSLLEMSHYAQPTLYRIIDELLRDGELIVSGCEEEGGKGRPSELLSLNGKKRYVLALHISRTSFASAVISFSDQMLACRRRPISADLTPEGWARAIESDFAEMCASLALTADEFCGVGLAAVGPLEYRRGIMLNPLHFASPHWHSSKIRELAQQAVRLPVVLDCNARAALMGHYKRDYYRKYRNIAYFTIGTGIGSGIILNRQLDTNTSVVLDGLAHMVIDADGRRCTCGEYGCVEAYVSTNAVVNQCVRAMRLGQPSSMRPDLDGLRFSHVCAAFEEGDPLAREQLQIAANILAKGIVNYLRMVSLEAVILGGSFIEQLPSFFSSVCKLVKDKGLGVRLFQAQDEDTSILHGIAGEVILQQL